MPDTRNAKDRLPRIATHKFFDFYIQKRDLTNLFDQFHSTGLFFISFCLYRACFTHLISSNLSCNLCLWYYDQLVHFDKEINANVYRQNLWEYNKRFHCSFEWHLTPGRHPVLSGHYSLPRVCPLNTGFTVILSRSKFQIIVTHQDKAVLEDTITSL